MALTLHDRVATILVALLVLGMSWAFQAECRPQWGRLPKSLAERHGQWMAHHGRVYKDKAEKEKRREIFRENVDFVEKFNSKPNQTFKLSANPFADLTHQEFQQTSTGGFKVANLSRQSTSFASKSPFQYQSLDSLPSSMDWRQKGAVTSVRNQGQCRSCWAFASVAAIEGITKIQTGKLPFLSEQQLIDCVTEGENTQGCNGGNQDEAFTYIIQNGGITAESNYPYQESDGYCDMNRASQHAAQIKGFVDVPQNNENALLSAVSQQPVSAFVDSSSREFQFYSSGVFTGNCGTALDHIVTIVGYGTAQDGSKYWLVKNSWGTGWGEDGYIRMQRNSGSPQGQCGIAMYASYPTV